VSWIDITVPVTDGMLRWPDNPPVSLRRALDMGRGDEANVSALSLGVHTGTHMDAPVHFLPRGAGVAELDPEAGIGPARVVAIADRVRATAAELRELEPPPRPGERLLLKTGNSARRWFAEPFRADYVFLAPDGARYLAERGIALIGTDYLSVGAPGPDGPETHRVLLDAGISILEGLDLSAVEPGRYEMVCLPLRLAGSDGAPARALLRRR
jgi:arylformamidase